MAYTWDDGGYVADPDEWLHALLGGLAVVAVLWLAGLAAVRVAEYRPDRAALDAARARLEHCARGYLGARLDRTQSVHWVALPESAEAVRARVALPDTVYLHPAWRASEWTLAHELLHVAVGRPGHPALPFAGCGLLRPEVGE